MSPPALAVGVTDSGHPLGAQWCPAVGSVSLLLWGLVAWRGRLFLSDRREQDIPTLERDPEVHRAAGTRAERGPARGAWGGQRGGQRGPAPVTGCWPAGLAAETYRLRPLLAHTVGPSPLPLAGAEAHLEVLLGVGRGGGWGEEEEASQDGWGLGAHFLPSMGRRAWNVPSRPALNTHKAAL